MAACHIHLTPVESCPYCTGPYLPVSEVNVLEAVKPIAGGSSACPAEYLVQQIEKTGAPTDPCCPKAATKDCTLKGDKFYDLTVAPFYIPPVGLSNPLVVCEGDYWKIGMWAYVDGAGTFEITNVVGDTLTVRNGCSNGASIPANQAPGKQIVAGILVYPVGPAECPLDALEGESICLTHIPDSEANEVTHLFGGTLDEISFEVDEDVVVKKASCMRKLANLFSNGKSLLMSLMDATDLTPVSIDGSDQYKEMVVWNPTAGELQRLIAEPCAAIGTNHNGKMVNILGGNYARDPDGPAHLVVWLAGPNKCGLKKLSPPVASNSVLGFDLTTGEPKWQSGTDSFVLTDEEVIFDHQTAATIEVDVDLTAVSGYDPKYKIIILACWTAMSAFQGDGVVELIIEGRVPFASRTRVRGTSNTFITDGDNDVNDVMVKIPDNKNLKIRKAFTPLPGGNSFEVVLAKVWVIGWI